MKDRRTIKIGRNYYQIYCKCGKLKEVATKYKCDSCIGEKSGKMIDGRWYKKNCKCGALKEDIKISLCNSCKEKKNKSKSRLSDGDRNELVNFVSKIRRRGGLASVEEIFVHMITIYSKYYSLNKLDNKKTGKQLTMMWKSLNELYDRAINGKLIEVMSSDEREEKRREWREYRRRYYEKNPDKIKEYNRIRSKKDYERIKKKKSDIES